MADQQNKKTNNLNSLLQKYLSLPKNTPDPRLLQELKKQSNIGMQDALGPAILALFGLGTSSGLPNLLRGASVLDAVAPQAENGTLEAVVPTPVKVARKAASLLPKLRQTIETQTKIDPLTLLHEKISSKPTDFHRTFGDSVSHILQDRIKPSLADGIMQQGVATSRVPAIGSKTGPISLGIQTTVPRRPFQASGYEKNGYFGRPNASFEFENRTKQGRPIPAKDITHVFLRNEGGSDIDNAIKTALSQGKPVFMVPSPPDIYAKDPFRTINARLPLPGASGLRTLIKNSGEKAVIPSQNFYDDKWGKQVLPPKKGLADVLSISEKENKPKENVKKFMDWDGFDSFSKKMDALSDYIAKEKNKARILNLEPLHSTGLMEDVLNQVKTKGANNVSLSPKDFELFNLFFDVYVKNKK